MNTVVLSIDAELGWGFHDLDDPPAERIDAARDGWRTLLDLLDEFDAPATWGVVGHLLLEGCHGVHESHPLGPNWFERERDAWADRPELRFGRELVDATLSADVDHELGFQTFSHVELGDEHVSPQLARAECAAFFDALEDAAPEIGDDEEQPSTVSVLFPRDAVGHRDVLAEWGFECYRGSPPRDAEGGPRDDERDGADGARSGRGTRDAAGGLRGAVRALADATISTPPVVEPTVDEYGMVSVPPSLYLYDLDERTRRLCERLRTDPVVRAARRGVDAVAEDGGVLHLWLHPNDLVDERDVRRLRRVLEYVDRRRGDDLEVATLGEVARRVRPTLAADPPEARP